MFLQLQLPEEIIINAIKWRSQSNVRHCFRHGSQCPKTRQWREDVVFDQLAYHSCFTEYNQAFWRRVMRLSLLNMKFRDKRDGTSHISHLLGAKCKFVLLQSWHVADSSVLQTKHASKSHETKIHQNKQKQDITCSCFNRTVLEKMHQILSVALVEKVQVVCQLFMLWWLIENGVKMLL